LEVIHHHIFAINATIKKLAFGKFWIYLIPGFLISLLFWDINQEFSFLKNQNYKADGIIDFFSNFSSNISHFLHFFLHEIYKFIILTILSPIYCLLSEKVDNEFTGDKFNFNLYRFLVEVIRAFFNICISLFLNMWFIGIWFLISLITGFHQLDTLIYFLISSYFVGFACYDYSMERYRVGVFSSWRFIRKNRLNTLITGVLFYFIFYIPLIGICLAPFLITIISTIVYLIKIDKLKYEN
jgi:CysZ protein